MNKSDSIARLSDALCKAQAVIQGAKKDARNPHFNKTYADLASVWEACREPLTKNGLAVAQLPGQDELGCYVETVLTHSSGEWLAGKVYITPVKNDPQAVGSAITYGRRYALAAMVGVAPEDDDGEAAMSRNQAASTQQERKPAAAGTKVSKKERTPEQLMTDARVKLSSTATIEELEKIADFVDKLVADGKLTDAQREELKKDMLKADERIAAIAGSAYNPENK